MLTRAEKPPPAYIQARFGRARKRVHPWQPGWQKAPVALLNTNDLLTKRQSKKAPVPPEKRLKCKNPRIPPRRDRKAPVAFLNRSDMPRVRRRVPEVHVARSGTYNIRVHMLPRPGPDTYFAGCGLQNRDYQNEQNTAPQTRISPDADPNPGWRRFLTQRYQKDKDIS